MKNFKLLSLFLLIAAAEMHASAQAFDEKGFMTLILESMALSEMLKHEAGSSKSIAATIIQKNTRGYLVKNKKAKQIAADAKQNAADAKMFRVAQQQQLHQQREQIAAHGESQYRQNEGSEENKDIQRFVTAQRAKNLAAAAAPLPAEDDDSDLNGSAVNFGDIYSQTGLAEHDQVLNSHEHQVVVYNPNATEDFNQSIVNMGNQYTVVGNAQGSTTSEVQQVQNRAEANKAINGMNLLLNKNKDLQIRLDQMNRFKKLQDNVKQSDIDSLAQEISENKDSLLNKIGTYVDVFGVCYFISVTSGLHAINDKNNSNDPLPYADEFKSIIDKTKALYNLDRDIHQNIIRLSNSKLYSLDTIKNAIKS